MRCRMSALTFGLVLLSLLVLPLIHGHLRSSATMKCGQRQRLR